MVTKDIVKVQLPPSGPGPVLVYDAKRARRCFIEALPERVLKMMEGHPKAYFIAEWENGAWSNFSRRVKDQPW